MKKYCIHSCTKLKYACYIKLVIKNIINFLLALFINNNNNSTLNFTTIKAKAN